MNKKKTLAYFVLLSISIPLANQYIDTLKVNDCEIQVTNMTGDKSIDDILESTDSVNAMANTFEIRIMSNTDLTEKRCVIGADILKAFYKKNRSKYTKFSKEQRYSNFLKDLIKESKLSRVEYQDPLDESNIGKDK